MPYEAPVHIWLRKMKAGRAAYHCWYRPVGAVRRMIHYGGPFEMRRTEIGRQEMEAAVSTLLLPDYCPGAPVRVHILTGNRYWYQTAFCLWTYARQTTQPLHPVIYDDGTLKPEQKDGLMRLFPQTHFVDHEESRYRMETHLSDVLFPHLRELWLSYPNIRKLIDPHLAAAGWKLVIDSDLLFFHEPKVLVRWLNQPERPLHAVDCGTYYGYTRYLLEGLLEGPIPQRVNVGLCGLASHKIDWEKIEFWCAVLMAREGRHYFLEQALVALMMAGSDPVIAPADEYVTRPVLPEARDCNAVMHHYVSNSKRWYFQHGWKVAMEAPSPAV